MNNSPYNRTSARFLAGLSLFVLASLSACGGSGNAYTKSTEEGSATTSFTVTTPATTTRDTAAARPNFSPASRDSDEQLNQATLADSEVVTTAVTATSAPGSAIESAVFTLPASRADLSAQQFSDEVRAYMYGREGQVKQTLQWYAVFQQDKDGRSARITIIGIGGDKSPSASLVVASTPVKTYKILSDDQLSQDEHKKAICLGRDTNSNAEYFDLLDAYNSVTEAMVTGMPTNSTRDAIYERLDQMREAESHLPSGQQDQAIAARTAIREQREQALLNCAGVKY